MKMKHSALLVALLLSACGPRYATDYALTPPASAQGKNCANACFFTRSGCVDACNNSARICRANDSGFYGNVGYGFGTRHGPWTGVGYSSPWGASRNCGAEANACTENCEASYRQCFTACGGKVESRTRCVERCESVDALPIAPLAP